MFLFYQNYFSYKFLENKWLFFSLVFLLSQLFSSFFYGYNSSSLLRVLSFIKFIIFAISIELVFKNNIKYFKFFIILTFTCCSIILIDSVIQYFNGFNIFGYPYTNQRIGSIFGEEKIVGSFLLKTSFISITLIYFYFNNEKYKNLLILLWLLANGFVILITGERMASILFLFGVSLFYLFFFFKKKISIVYLYSFLIIIFLIVSSNSVIKNRFSQILHDDYGLSKDLSIKNSIWGSHFVVALAIYKNNQLFGVGPKNFRVEACLDKYQNIDSKKAAFRCTTHPHNIFLELIAEHGIIGIICFILIIFFVIKSCKLSCEITFLFCLSLLLYIWPLGTSGSIFTTWNGTFLWIYIGIINFLNYNQQKIKN
jgi:O-antigen ligase